MNKNIRKKYKKPLFILTLVFIVCYCFVNVGAASGYTYNRKGQPIYSTVGYNPIDKSITYADLNVQKDLGATSTTPNPEDLFVYNGVDEKTVYISDSSLNLIIVLNENLNKLYQFSSVFVDPDLLQYTNVYAIKSEGAIMFQDLETLEAKKLAMEESGSKFEIKLKNPKAVYRAYIPNVEKEYLYIADTGNNQVIICDVDDFDPVTNKFTACQIITKPTEELATSVIFSPKKVIASEPGRVYVIADNITEGIMEFSYEGTFNRYIGTNKVTLTPWEIFWRNLSSEEQLEKQVTIYNTTFTSMAISDAMIYSTSYAIKNKSGDTDSLVMLKKINPVGSDVLRRNGYQPPQGDVMYAYSRSMVSADFGPSTFVGVTVNEYGIYSALDSKRGRIFTYDNEGNLLYISGEMGTQIDKLGTPSAIQYLGDDLLVLDILNQSIKLYQPTEIGSIINQAVYQEYIGRVSREGIVPVFNPNTGTWWIDKTDTLIVGKNLETKIIDGYWWIGDTNTNIAEEALAAADYWEKVITLNANYEYAYIGIGHKYMKDKNYKLAMENYKLGFDMLNYGKSFKLYRDGLIKDNINAIGIVLLVLIGGVIARKVYKRVKKGRPVEEEDFA